MIAKYWRSWVFAATLGSCAGIGYYWLAEGHPPAPGLAVIDILSAMICGAAGVWIYDYFWG